MKRNKHSALSSALTKTVFARFFTALVVTVAAILLLYFGSYLVLRLFPWQAGNPLYIIFKAIEKGAPLILPGLALVAFIIVFGYYWRKTLGYIDVVVAASEILAAPDDALVQLPAELKQVEDRMNLVKHNAARNARLAKESEQRKNDLIVYLAHDIKTPLTSVVGYLSLLEEAPDMPPEQRAKYVRITLDKAYRLEQLIDEFFEITRYNLQGMTLAKQDIDLYYMLVQMADEFYPQLAANGQKAVIHAAEHQRVYGDPDKLARVFNNILKNAVAYSEKNSVIHITAGAAGNMVSVVFQNTGSIPQNKLSSIFEKFYRLDEARSSEKGGAGLGLAIAKEIVLLHGGEIRAESADNRTMFTVLLPAISGAAEAKST